MCFLFHRTTQPTPHLDGPANNEPEKSPVPVSTVAADEVPDVPDDSFLLKRSRTPTPVREKRREEAKNRDIVLVHPPHLQSNPATTRGALLHHDTVFIRGVQGLLHDARDLHAGVQGLLVAGPGLHAEESHLLKENVPALHEGVQHHH
ncbi:hypothetical protein OS493_032254 [Desmophyllum pertusum]|uniref:Uncharacterized protein n=1 Tax=Desmophyllum pertusum TaxID=174260 RepID=A0A9W9ZJV8_9CNID|nr:hypothetical protein OS493_032254 [Desmophyllum pertusum]